MDPLPNPISSTPHKQQRISYIVFAVLFLAVAAGGFVAGARYEARSSGAETDAIITRVINEDEGQPSAVDFSLFWQVWESLHDRYVDADTLDARTLVYGAISGMVRSVGDPYTVFFEPATTRKFQEDVGGAFSGVGMEIGQRDGLVTVITPLQDSPAIRAGVQAGDKILAVDGADATMWSVEEAVDHIRGKKGSTVTLTLRREGVDDVFDVSIVRDTIKITAVTWKLLADDVAYLQIKSFNANVDAEFSRAVSQILDSKATRLIVDVRNNPGGLLDSAVNLSGWFLPRGSTVVEERFGDSTSELLKAAGNERLVGFPIVVLMNGGSASAAEILAGALHDMQGIPLIGEQTFGKGSVQQLEGFFNGSSLKVTIAKWFTPNGVSISDTGIAPTTEVSLDPNDPAADQWELGEPGKDPQLDRALEIVRSLR